MDNTKELTVVEWFTGYGGNELGLKRVIPNMRPIAFCERESFVIANLVSKMEAGLMDPVPVWSDATTFPAEPFKDRVGLFIASYPCQPFSHAGKRDGQNDERHLWPACRRFVQGARPRLVFFENVEGHVTLGLSTVLADLEEDGYTAAWGIFSASEVGAPHQRKRVFILAYDRLQRQTINELKTTGVAECGQELALRDSIGCPHGEPTLLPTEAGIDAQRDTSTGGGEDVAHHHHQGLQGLRERGGQERWEIQNGHIGSDSQVWPSRPGERQYAWEPPRVVCGGRRELDNSVFGGLEREGEVESGRKAADMAGEGVVENSVQQRVQRGTSVAGRNDGGWQDCETALSSGGSEDRSADISKVKSEVGGNPNGTPNGMDFPRCTGLSDTELEDIYGWMEKGTNRTDELRACGNGVVPATAERAFRVLYAELKGVDNPGLL